MSDEMSKYLKEGQLRWATKKGFHRMWPPERMLLLLVKGKTFGTLIARNVITNILHDPDDFSRWSKPVTDPRPLKARKR